MDLIYWVLLITYGVLLVSTILIIVTDNSNSDPGKALAWLVLIFFLPLIGIFLYFIFGFDRRRGNSADKDRYGFLSDLIPLLPQDFESYANPADAHFDRLDSDYHGLVKLLESGNRSRLLYGSKVEIITDGNRKFEKLMEDLKNARHHIHFEYFLFRKDEISRRIRALLMQKAEEGVEVRFIYDNIANIDIFPSYYNKMRKSGVQVKPFTKFSLSSIRRNPNNRNHRKVVVIDGKIGYVGGMNITSQTQRWRDAHLRLQGEGVHGLQISFLQIWHGSKGILPKELAPYFPKAQIFTGNLMQIVPDTPDSNHPYYSLAIVNAIENARKHIYIQTPYFMPTDSLKRALKTAALKGVEVRLMVSQKSDFAFMDWAIQANYEEMLSVGVHIHEIQNYFSHAKSMVIDDYLSVIGTTNLDHRSLELNFEINAFMYDPEVAAQNKQIFITDMQGCQELTLAQWQKRSWKRKTLQTIMRFFSPLL